MKKTGRKKRGEQIAPIGFRQIKQTVVIMRWIVVLTTLLVLGILVFYYVILS